MEETVIKLPSLLYSELFQLGGDKLIAVFCILKNECIHGRFNSYVSGNKVKVEGINLLRKETNLSLSVLNKYVPMLIELGLVKINAKGGAEVMGNNRLRDIYCAPDTYTDSKGRTRVNSKAGTVKLVPVVISDKFLDTSYNAASVRLHSSERKQQRTSAFKTRQLQLVKAFYRNDPSLTAGERKKAQKIILKLGENKISITNESVMSLQGYAKLKDGSKNNKSKGQYVKKKLLEKGLITVTRRFKPIREISFSEYKFLKENKVLSRNNTYKEGRLLEEIVSEFRPIGRLTKF